MHLQGKRKTSPDSKSAVTWIWIPQSLKVSRFQCPSLWYVIAARLTETLLFCAWVVLEPPSVLGNFISLYPRAAPGN